MKSRAFSLLPLLLLAMSVTAQPSPRLKTRWTDKVSKTRPHPEYPRQQMVSEGWVNLNGQWDFALSKSADPSAISFDKKILVPFPVESYLSGLQLHVAEG